MDESIHQSNNHSTETLASIVVVDLKKGAVEGTAAIGSVSKGFNDAIYFIYNTFSTKILLDYFEVISLMQQV